MERRKHQHQQPAQRRFRYPTRKSRHYPKKRTCLGKFMETAVLTINRPLPDISPGRKFAPMDFGITSVTSNIASAIRAPNNMVAIADSEIKPVAVTVVVPPVVDMENDIFVDSSLHL